MNDCPECTYKLHGSADPGRVWNRHAQDLGFFGEETPKAIVVDVIDRFIWNALKENQNPSFITELVALRQSIQPPSMIGKLFGRAQAQPLIYDMNVMPMVSNDIRHLFPMKQGGGGGGGGVRHYSVTSCSVGKTGGRYASLTGPAAAAKKAATKRMTGSVNKVRLTVRELGTDREFMYQATRTKLSKPYERVIGGKKIVSKYEVEVKAVRK